MHESKITAENTILVTAYNVTRCDLSSIGGPVDGWVADCLFYELDIKTNKILFKWGALDHVDQVPISDVTRFYPLADYLWKESISSVRTFPHQLISSLFEILLFFVQDRDGTVKWTLQGQSGGDFELGKGLSFAYQHDARVRGELGYAVQISVFDNVNSDVVSGVNQTKSIFLTLNKKTKKAALDYAYTDPRNPLYANSQGNVQKLDDGHIVIGYGSTPEILEYSRDGSVAMSAQFGPGDGYIFSYSAFRLPWIGRPKTAPDVFACTDAMGDRTMVYMSWLGATEHKCWKVFAGANKSSLTLAAVVEKTGFETVTSVPGQVSLIRVEAHGPDLTISTKDLLILNDVIVLTFHEFSTLR